MSVGCLHGPQYSLSARSLLQALKVDDPEETLFIQAYDYRRSVQCWRSASCCWARVFPEFLPAASNLSEQDRLSLSGEQQFLLTRHPSTVSEYAPTMPVVGFVPMSQHICTRQRQFERQTVELPAVRLPPTPGSTVKASTW